MTRVRRTADEAREAILDAAEHQLVESGPDAMRLTLVATEVGVSHSTVLHHFGSREELVQAVVNRANDRLQIDLVEAIAGATATADLLDRVATVLGAEGHGRAIAWLALSGQSFDPGDLRLRKLAEVAHATRKLRHGGTEPFEDTLYTIMMAFFTLFAQSVVGDALFSSAGLTTDDKSQARFRRWFGVLIEKHLLPT